MNIMIDIETLGCYPGCAVFQLGMVPFNIGTRVVGEGVLINIDKGQLLAEGFKTEESTLAFWEGQPQAQ